jgi:hypothetical protein
MKSNTLAQSYLLKASHRLRIFDVLMEVNAFSDVVREAQEIVELALKGTLRHVGIEPPKWHDVGSLLQEYADRFPQLSQHEIDRLAMISAWLRKEREFSFYGDIDMIPTELYVEADAQRAIADAQYVVETATRVIGS